MDKLVEGLAVMAFVYFAFDYAGLTILVTVIGGALTIGYVVVSGDAPPWLDALIVLAGLPVLVGAGIGLALGLVKLGFRVLYAPYVAMCRQVNAQADMARAYQEQLRREADADAGR